MRNWSADSVASSTTRISVFIASLIGTSGTSLSMWLAKRAKPHTAELAEIERLLTDGQLQTHQDDIPPNGDSSLGAS
jgi:hypothetical protein